MNKTKYVDTVISNWRIHFIDMYISLRVKKTEDQNLKAIEPKLEDIVNRMFERCFADKEYFL